MFKMSYLCANTCLQMLSSLMQCRQCSAADHSRRQQSLLQFVDIVDPHLIDTLLYDSLNLVVNGGSGPGCQVAIDMEK